MTYYIDLAGIQWVSIDKRLTELHLLINKIGLGRKLPIVITKCFLSCGKINGHLYKAEKNQLSDLRLIFFEA